MKIPYINLSYKHKSKKELIEIVNLHLEEGDIPSEIIEEARKYIFNNRFDTVFFKPKLGDSAGVFGAALL